MATAELQHPRVTKIPALSREESLEYWGLSTSHHWAELDAKDDKDALASHGFEDGWIVVDPASGGHANTESGRIGLNAHRGVIQREEYVDAELLLAYVEELLGFTAAQVHAAFATGRPTQERLALRAAVDQRVLEIAESGGNVLALARALGLAITNDGSAPNCRSIERSLARAREASCAL